MDGEYTAQGKEVKKDEESFEDAEDTVEQKARKSSIQDGLPADAEDCHLFW